MCIFQRPLGGHDHIGSGADGHYIREQDRKLAGLPILQPSPKRVGVANGETSTATHVTWLSFPQLSTKAAQMNSFKNFQRHS